MIDSMSVVILWGLDSTPCLPRPSLMTVAQSRSCMDALLGAPNEESNSVQKTNQSVQFQICYRLFALYEYILQSPKSSALESVGLPY